MEKVKEFLFYHGEKVGLAVVVLLCLLSLLAAKPWSTDIPEAQELARALSGLRSAMSGSVPETVQYQAPDLMSQLQARLAPLRAGSFERGMWAFYDIDRLPEERPELRVAAVSEVRVIPERGRLKVTWSVDPAQQALENSQARYDGIIELVKAVIYRAPANQPDQLREVGSTPLEDVVIVPPVTAASRPSTRPRFTGGLLSSRPGTQTVRVPAGKVPVEDAEQAGRFVYADADVEADQDYVYKVKLVALNPRYDPNNPGSAPQFIESDLEDTPVSLAQRPLPSIRWFFVGGSPGRAGIRVYKWEVFNIPAAELAQPQEGTAAEAAAEEAAAGETVERAQWVDATFYVRPGEPIGRKVLRYVLVPGAKKPVKATIDFSTGCTAVAVESAPRIIDTPKVTLTAAGAPSVTRLVKDTLLLYYLDAEGQLRTRWQEPDLALAEKRATAATGAAEATAGPRRRPATGTRRAISQAELERRRAALIRREQAEQARMREAIRRAKQAEAAKIRQRIKEMPEELPPEF